VQESTLQPRPRRRSLNEPPKIVFSRTLKTVQWKNARLAGGDIGEEINRVKRQRGKDIALFGSADLGSTFIRLGLHIMFSAAG
jgi:dihydrofolate reductase